MKDIKAENPVSLTRLSFSTIYAPTNEMRLDADINYVVFLVYFLYVELFVGVFRLVFVREGARALFAKLNEEKIKSSLSRAQRSLRVRT